MKTNRRLSFVLSGFALLGVACPEPAPPPEPTPGPGPVEPAATPAEFAFRDALNTPPPGWTGSVFQLSHDYPAAPLPPCDRATECPWLAVDVDFSVTEAPVWSDYADYFAAIVGYASRGNDLTSGWNAVVDGKTTWFHVPWMAYDAQVGREFVHGMTNERTTPFTDLEGDPPHRLPIGDKWSATFETWAVGMYNPYGGSVVGGLIPESGVPLDPGPGVQFPEGTLVIKTLFTAATPADVPYLEGSPAWTINRHVDSSGCSQVPYDQPFPQECCDRKPQVAHLVQVDLAVVDDRSPTGWVYATLGYSGEGTDPPSTVWERLRPLGMMWGNDPNAWPGNPDQTKATILESVLAPSPGIYEHYGCAAPLASQQRLAGPVDNRRSACISCHQNAYFGAVGVLPARGALPSLFPSGLCTISDMTNRRYFSNLAPLAPYPNYPGLKSLGTSLQLLVAYTNQAAYQTQQRPNDRCTNPQPEGEPS